MIEYKTLKTAAQAEYEEKHSKFIGAVMPVTTEKQALDFIASRRQDTYGARHNVYAYILRENNISRYSDDGEPHSTAGMPTLDVLRKQCLVDCCVVTTRYFGGILLGTGGLVRAYTLAASKAVEKSGIAIMRESCYCSVECDYPEFKMVESLIVSAFGRVENSEFTNKVIVKFWVTKENYDELYFKFRDTFCGKIFPEILKIDFAEA